VSRTGGVTSRIGAMIDGGMSSRAPAALAVIAGIACALLSAPAASAVRLGDAVPGVIKGADLERIRRQLDLDRFSVIAAVWLGAGEGREAIVVEPIDDAALAKIKEACAKGGFCPDRLGFVASRVRIVRLQNNDVLPVILVDREIRGSKGALLDLAPLTTRGHLTGWSGWAEAAFGHVALALTPILERSDGRLRPATDDPLRIQWNEETGRFQHYVCRTGADTGTDPDAAAETICEFENESGG
jgi:hypothetical protein